MEKEPDERLDELEAVVQADDKEIEQAARQVAAEVAGTSRRRAHQAGDLSETGSEPDSPIPARPADPRAGQSARAGRGPPEDLIPFVPDRPRSFSPETGRCRERLGVGRAPRHGWVRRGVEGPARSFRIVQPGRVQVLHRSHGPSAVCAHEAKVLDRVMRQGRHPGIVRLEATYLSADPPCLQYEYVEGGDSAAGSRTAIVSGEALGGASGQGDARLAEIVAFAHRLDPPIVHRDLKPANILVQRSRSGEIALKITDFGIGGIATARADTGQPRAHQPKRVLDDGGSRFGDLLYASPEQLRSNDPDPAMMCMQLGVIWYQMLIGDLTKGRPGGTAWRRRFLERGMSAGSGRAAGVVLRGSG